MSNEKTTPNAGAKTEAKDKASEKGNTPNTAAKADDKQTDANKNAEVSQDQKTEEATVKISKPNAKVKKQLEGIFNDNPALTKVFMTSNGVFYDKEFYAVQDSRKLKDKTVKAFLKDS